MIPFRAISKQFYGFDNSIYIVYAVFMAMQLKQIKFDEEDLKAVEAIQRLYGCESFSQAVRLAARIVASRERAEFPLPPVPKHAPKRRHQSLLGLVRLPPAQAEQFDQALRQLKHKAHLETLSEWVMNAEGQLEFNPQHSHESAPAQPLVTGR